MTDSDPFSDEASEPPPTVDGLSLKERSIAWFKSNPDITVLFCVLCCNLLVLGHVTGRGLEPYRLLPNISWLRCRPFPYTLNVIDASLFGFATAQVALISIWASFSGRQLMTRLSALVLTIATFTLALMATMWTHYGTTELVPVFLILSLTVSLGCVWLRALGWKADWSKLSATPEIDGRLSSRELMVLAGIVALSCGVIAFLTPHSIKVAWVYLAGNLFTAKYLWHFAACGVLGVTSVFVALLIAERPGTASPKGQALALAGSALTFLLFFGTYLIQTSCDAGYMDRSQQIVGTMYWAGLHVLLQMLALGCLAAVGFRFSRNSDSEKTNAQRWILWMFKSAAVAALVTGLYFATIHVPRAWKLASANRVVYGIGYIASNPSDTGLEYSLTLVDGLTMEQASALNKIVPELRSVVVVQTQAADSPEEIEALISLTSVQSFDVRVLQLGSEAIQALEQKRPDATILD